MSFINTAHDIPDSMENRLRFWLSMDLWTVAEAAQVISGIDPDKTILPSKNGYHHSVGSITLFNGSRIPEPRYVDYIECNCGEEHCNICGGPNDVDIELMNMEVDRLKAYFQKSKNITRLFNDPTNNTFSPKEWIERSLAKGINISWLNWAIERGVLPDGLKGKILAVAENGGIRLIDTPKNDRKVESPLERRERIRARVIEEKAKGTKGFYKVVAEEENLSISRIKQLVNDGASEVQHNTNSPWAGLTASTRQAGSQKPSPK